MNLFDDAIADLSATISIGPPDAADLRLRAWYFMQSNDIDSAISDFDEAIRLDPFVGYSFSRRGLCWLRKREYEKAIADLDEAIRLDPKDAFAYSNRSRCWFTKCEFEKAIDDCEEAFRLDATDLSAKVALAWMLSSSPVRRCRDGRRAVALATEACQKSEWKYVHAIEALAAAYAESGRNDRPQAEIGRGRRSVVVRSFWKHHDTDD